VQAQALANLQTYVAAAHKIGQDVRVSAIYAAAQVSGVEHVELLALNGSIAGDVSITSQQASYCTGITVTYQLAS
jgi:phage-related baseplate assembly protein